MSRSAPGLSPGRSAVPILSPCRVAASELAPHSRVVAASDVTITIPIAAPADVVFDAMTDWARQSSWMLATDVRPVGPQRRAVGDRLEAFTGLKTPLGGLGFLDTMVVADWVPGRSVTVVHTGRVVQGTGTFAVTPRSKDLCELAWSENLRIPGGAAGRLQWLIISPFSRWAVRYSLQRFAQQVEDGISDTATKV